MATLFCAKKYNIQKYLQTECTRNANSLKTFRTFVSGTDTTEIKDAILVSATQSIFTHSETGYLKNQDIKNSTNIIIDKLANKYK